MEDLTAMGCAGFYGKLWGFRYEAIVREILDGAPNQFDNTLRPVPPMWTKEVWRGVYNFQSGCTTQANRKDDYVRGKFKGAASPKDGYAVEDSVNGRHRRLLEFLVLILHPEKPTWVTSMIGNTILGTLSEEKRMDWAKFIYGLVN